ncbi:MFS transporter [Geodermatophilus sp. SYSU D00696]
MTAPPAAPSPAAGGARPAFPRIVFTLSFALLLSDFMCRQVLAAVFPQLKAEWGLSDTRIAALSSVVPLTVAVLTVPLSVLADRLGRRRAVTAMAAGWSLATLGSALAADYGQLLAARALVGVGEAAYASVGLALVLGLFPADRRATLAGAFTAGASFGAVLGIALGGALAARFGWRWSVAAMAAIGFVLVALYHRLVTDEQLARHEQVDGASGAPAGTTGRRVRLSALVSPPAVVCAYVGNGLQLLVAGALLTWLPSYLERTYRVPLGAAAGLAAALVLVMGIGMIGCGVLADRLARAAPRRTWTTALVCSASSLLLLGLAFSLPPGPAQLALLAAGALTTAGTTGPAGALVVSLTAASVRAGALGVLALAGNLLGLTAGPLVVGVLADRIGLAEALRWVSVVSLAAVAVFAIGRRAAPDGTTPPAVAPDPARPTVRVPVLRRRRRGVGKMDTGRCTEWP